MRSISKKLQHNEYLLSMANFHWYIFIPGIILYLFALATFIFNDFLWFVLGVYIMGIAFVSLLVPIIKNITTELTITSKRVIFKTGLINRKKVELNLYKIKSICINQSSLGRILSFGTLILNHVDGKQTKIYGICKPFEFENEARQIIDAE